MHRLDPARRRRGCLDGLDRVSRSQRRPCCQDASVSDGMELRNAMLAAIGRVAMNSGDVSMQVQQLAESVTGTGLIYFIMRDLTLGQQLGQVKMMVEQATTNEWIRHPPMDADVRTLILEALRPSRLLVEFRNRVVHDIWNPEPTESRPDGIYGYRATAWGKQSVSSTVGTLNLIASSFFLAACTLCEAERALVDLRKENHSRDDVMMKVKEYHRELIQREAAIKSGVLTGWHWVTT